ncbi:hypothetical protein LCGC14_0360160 [marine sediment metagenome]|uniref:Uncharacterized protein n=1 Tax=marine sediment metagenome TaxID=412755 RepID=A0A0F9TR89_9ZZZZ
MLEELKAILLDISPKHLNAEIILFGKGTPREKIVIVYEETK